MAGIKEKTVREAIAYRRSVRAYTDEALDDEKVKDCIYQATLAPTSSNLQLWEFYHVTDKQKCEEIAKACFNQVAARTANQLVVVVADETSGAVEQKPIIPICPMHFERPIHFILLKKKWY